MRTPLPAVVHRLRILRILREHSGAIRRALTMWRKGAQMPDETYTHELQGRRYATCCVQSEGSVADRSSRGRQ